MSDDRQPGYDFFPPPQPTTPATPRSGPPHQPYPGPMTGVVPRQSPPWADQIPPARRSSIPAWLIVLIVLFVALVTSGILAAVAIPVFLSQRLKAEYQATTVELPATFNGQKRNTGTQATEVAKSVAIGGINAKDVAVYGRIGPDTVIIVALKPPAPMSEAQQTVERNDFERAFASTGSPLFLIKAPDAGELGGWIGCGNTVQGPVVCLATSVGSMVTVITSAEGDPVTLLRQARAATVSRS